MVKVGLEIHQQLATKKLFCDCESDMKEEVLGEFRRYLRATRSEIGEVDRAAKEEELKRRIFRYQITENTCLVEMDEEPPHPLNTEALKVALTVAEMMNAEVVDEIHFMRKIVIDGSNTSGFQRTALVALNGYIETSFGEVGIPTICLEEEAARKIETKEGEVIYRLDRLGIPLIEIATTPSMSNGEEVKEVAAKIGYILRSTKKVRRGLGTIRQDLNISVEGGARTEIKGVQNLKMLPKYVDEEIKRQKMLIEIAGILRDRGVKEVKPKPVDVTEVFRDTNSKIIKNALKRNWVVYAQPLPGFQGVLKSEKYRLGKELASYVKTVGLRGIFHTDELPAYGITEEELRKIRSILGEDVFVLIASPKNIVDIAIERIVQRANLALEGVVEETRAPLPDGTTEYMRPLPGAARMYPETDIPPVRISAEMLEKIRANLPEMPEEKIKRMVSEDGLAEQVAWQLFRDGLDEIYEELVEICRSPKIVARTLINTLSELEDEGYIIGDLSVLRRVFEEFAKGKFAKEGIPEILKDIAQGKSVEEAIQAHSSQISDEELRARIREVIESRRDLIEERGERAFSPLMGILMKEFRGKVDGKKISTLLKEELSKYLGG